MSTLRPLWTAVPDREWIARFQVAHHLFKRAVHRVPFQGFTGIRRPFILWGGEWAFLGVRYFVTRMISFCKYPSVTESLGIIRLKLGRSQRNTSDQWSRTLRAQTASTLVLRTPIRSLLTANHVQHNPSVNVQKSADQLLDGTHSCCICTADSRRTRVDTLSHAYCICMKHRMQPYLKRTSRSSGWCSSYCNFFHFSGSCAHRKCDQEMSNRY